MSSVQVEVARVVSVGCCSAVLLFDDRLGAVVAVRVDVALDVLVGRCVYSAYQCGALPAPLPIMFVYSARQGRTNWLFCCRLKTIAGSS